MIFFLCPKPDSPSGGVWYLYRLVQLLNEMGHKAYAVQTEPHLIWWDANPIPESMIIQLGSFPENGNDVWVVPEVLWPSLRTEMFPGRRLVFVQNHIWANGWPQELYEQSEMLECSRHLANFMRRVHNANIVGKITPFLDEGVWAPGEKVLNLTLVVARRNPYHEKMVKALREADFLVDYVTEPVTQRELAKKLARCEFCVHLTHPEGFPMACLEAQRSGAIVVGTTGGGGNEHLFDGQTALVVQDPENGRYGNPEEFIRRIMEKMNEARADAALRNKISTQALAWSKRYTAEATKEDLRRVLG